MRDHTRQKGTYLMSCGLLRCARNDRFFNDRFINNGFLNDGFFK